jgi:hypothetical protein
MEVSAKPHTVWVGRRAILDVGWKKKSQDSYHKSALLSGVIDIPVLIELLGLCFYRQKYFTTSCKVTRKGCHAESVRMI